jgi:hypothetical protein
MRISLNILNFVEIGRDSGGIIIIVVVDYMSVRILECKKERVNGGM